MRRRALLCANNLRIKRICNSRFTRWRRLVVLYVIRACASAPVHHSFRPAHVERGLHQESNRRMYQCISECVIIPPQNASVNASQPYIERRVSKKPVWRVDMGTETASACVVVSMSVCTEVFFVRVMSVHCRLVSESESWCRNSIANIDKVCGQGQGHGHGHGHGHRYKDSQV